MAKLSEIIGVIVLTSVWQTLICSECPANCVTCTHDSVDSGTTCTSCVPGKYSGSVYDYSDRPYYDDCSQDCRDDCVSCASYHNCTECVNGRFGTECQYSCYSGCEGGQCDKLDGKCSCKTGYTSRFCNGQLSCPNNPCACCKNNKCETNNSNYCSDGCIDDVRGDTCDNDCPANCETCTQDSVAGGLPCTSCVPGKYSGRIYDNSKRPYYDDCSQDCRDDCVSCASYTNCTECVNGRYGIECQYDCYIGCEGGQCDKMDGKCTCKPGDASRFCKSKTLCTNTRCKNNICDLNNNNFCTDGCSDGYWGGTCYNICPPDCVACTQDSVDGGLPCTSCVPGKYSGKHNDWSHMSYDDDCRHDCRDECVSCASYNNCTSCVPGKYSGRWLDYSYMPYNNDCSNYCYSGCVSCASYYNCTECVNGRYGTHCIDYCSTDCEGGVCSKTDGSCPSKTEKTYISLLYMAVGIVIALIILVLIAICGRYKVKLTSLIRRTCHRRRPVPPPEDNSVENDETEQDTRRESIEMAVLNENRETADIHVGGSIYYNPKRMLGSGSYGVVFEGRSGLKKNKPVAVKKVECLSNQDAKELLNINKEIKALETLENKHVIRFIDSYIYNTTVYLAFELAIGTLVDYVSPSNDSWRLSLTDDDVVRGIIAGLNYTHAKNILHRDLKPGNIFIVNHSDSGLKAVIGDFGQAKVMTGNTVTMTGNTGSNGYIAPKVYKAMLDSATVSLGTKCTKASDIFALGLVMYYVKSLGNNPFGINNLAAQDSISKGNPPNFQHIANRLDTIPYEDMLKQMLNSNQDDRPSITVVSEHPAIWTSDKIIKFFVLKSDEFEAMIRAGPSNKNLLEDPNLIPNGNWMNQLPVNMGTYLRRYTLPNRTSPMYSGKETEVRFLLRAIRNTNGHYQGYPQNTLAEMGAFPEGHVTLWLKVCPGLLMQVYNKLGPL